MNKTWETDWQLNGQMNGWTDRKTDITTDWKDDLVPLPNNTFEKYNYSYTWHHDWRIKLHCNNSYVKILSWFKISESAFFYHN